MNFQADFQPRLGHRALGFQKIFSLLTARRAAGRKLVMVETGCIRKVDWEGDGCSSLMFDAFAAETGAQFISIDVNAGHCALARQLCLHAEVICGDSVTALYRLRERLATIDLLYLDSFDLDWDHPHPAALHQFKELCAAAPLLQRGALVFADDHSPAAGKPMYVKEFMRDIGAEIVHEDYQIGFVLP